MSIRREPVEKLPLAARKNIRDEWEAKKGAIEEAYSEILGTPWTIEVNPNAIYAYAPEDNYAKNQPGGYLREVFETGSRRIRDFVDYFEGDAIDEINKVCSSHVLTLDVDETSKFTYNGVDVHEGKLRILFSAQNIASNIGDGMNLEGLSTALNDAPSSGHALPFKVRLGISREYDPKAEEVRAKIAGLLNKPDFKLVPNFEANYEKLLPHSKEAGTGLNYDWEPRLGPLTLNYFEGLISQLQWQKFGEDDMLQEAFNEVVEKAEVTLQVVDSLEKKTYGEFKFEDGVFVMRVTPKYWACNIDDVAEGLVDAL